jgi:formylglycine-generating enzyme required for sulfatase activity
LKRENPLYRNISRTIAVGLGLFCWASQSPVLGAWQDATPHAEPGIVAQRPAEGPFVETQRGFMVPYTATIPGTDITFEMIPIPGGTFRMGSPADEEDRIDDEGPQFDVTVPPCWMGKYEVTWGEYRCFMLLHDIFKKFQSDGIRKVAQDHGIDVVTAPSSLYDPSFTFQAGDDDRGPAATMTQFAAKQYTKWLSLTSQQFYRLPTEAEWEYACRAGTTTRYSFGDDAADLDDYAWHEDNSDGERHNVGAKKPNPWGLYDMHGNVAEWVLDAYTADGYAKFNGQAQTAESAFQQPAKVFPRVVRGGSFDLAVEDCRSAARLGSEDREWKEEDPNFPKSPWWYTTEPATGVGFRLIRPLDPPATREAQEVFWKADLPQIEEDAISRVRQEGRGALGIVDEKLPEAIQQHYSTDK